MKKTFNIKSFSAPIVTFVATLVLMSILMYACKKPTDGINILVDSQSLSPAPTMLSFVNADSTSVNQPGDFTASITGPGASLVQMVSGGTSFQVSHGILSLSLVKGTVPSVANPVVFTVTGQAAGFAPFIQTVVITQDAPSLYVVKALDYTSSAAGTTLLKTTTTLSGGTVSSATTLTTSKTASMTENATLAFAAGTQFQDANKNTINAGTLTSNIVQLGVGNNALTDDFPGGLYAADALDQSGNAISGGVNFVPAGLLSISMTANGTDVKNFSKPVNITMELNSNTANFATGAALKVGDVIPYWSQNDLTGQWKYEGNATVALDGSNKLSVVMPISHLSNWMCGWFWSATSTAGAAYTACGSNLTVNLSTADANFKGGNYTVYLLSAYGNIVASKKGGDLHNGSSVTFKNLPNIAQAKVAVYYKGKQAAVSTLFATCTTGSLAITVPTTATAFADPVNVSVSVTGLCNGKQVSVLPSAPFQLYQQIAGTQAFQPIGVVNIVNGKASTQLDNNATYYLSTYYNKTYYQTGNFTITKAAITIPPLTGFNVTTAYDATSNTLSFTGTIPVPCN
ncbi:hypothetical protein BEL04_10745 [Mucilaginibacter sp. PPCGB 2223]|uniref:hypothetical protein n=1 Tax=Mucilaginibacter sp. PPCGB 2223 TaxID=1886027 RepID=UPI0008256924|nr:hypothetical protein [Mucilaginibacter sp. PPCGB 2223]OCX54694.1 hypothetical protein BEL04_10745 [Mucilaginibacter sp. PPCGB 2223]